MGNIEIGDWIRFYRGGVLVIGVVEYLVLNAIGAVRGCQTNIGEVTVKEILEVRPKLAQVAMCVRCNAVNKKNNMPCFKCGGTDFILETPGERHD